jgi:Spy/CpxP family protein refolding chaperone
MKKIVLFAVFAVCALAAKAQTANEEVALMQSIYGVEKKMLIEEHMKITDAEATAFWAIYDEYELARKELGKKRFAAITDYAKNYGSISNEKATELANTTLDLYAEFTKLQKKTFKKMAKAISPVRAAQFIQAELYFENIVRLSTTDQIPLIGEFEAVKKK